MTEKYICARDRMERIGEEGLRPHSSPLKGGSEGKSLEIFAELRSQIITLECEFNGCL